MKNVHAHYVQHRLVNKETCCSLGTVWDRLDGGADQQKRTENRFHFLQSEE